MTDLDVPYYESIVGGKLNYNLWADSPYIGGVNLDITNGDRPDRQVAKLFTHLEPLNK